LLHGSGGVLASRDLTYAPQLARMGVAALVVDSFGARRDRGTEFIERVLNITETMMLADAYSGLGFLAARPEIDPRRVVLTGFSYGAMAAMYGMYAQIANKMAPGGPRFAGHVAFYGPCIGRFDDSRTTGAPFPTRSAATTGYGRRRPPIGAAFSPGSSAPRPARAVEYGRVDAARRHS